MSWLDRVLRRADSAPGAVPSGDAAAVQETLRVLSELRPMFEADGGDVELVSVEDGRVTVRLSGACKSCHASEMTLRDALEPRLRERLPWFVELHTVA